MSNEKKKRKKKDIGLFYDPLKNVREVYEQHNAQMDKFNKMLATQPQHDKLANSIETIKDIKKIYMSNQHKFEKLSIGHIEKRKKIIESFLPKKLSDE